MKFWLMRRRENRRELLIWVVRYFNDLICEIFIMTFSYTKISPYISQSQNDGEQCIICILAEAVYINKCVYCALNVRDM